MNESQEILLLLKNNFKKANAYFSEKGWRKDRCRIDAYFYTDVILDFFFMKNNANDINEYYLTQTRIINKNKKKDYKNSKNMDINALKQLLGFGSANKEIKKQLEKYSHEKVRKVIDNYINTILNTMDIVKYGDVLAEWNTYYASLLNTSEEAYQRELKKIIEQKELNILDINFLKNNLKMYDSYKNNNLDVDKNKLEIIGTCGEELVYKQLIKQYGSENVKWVSRINKYENHDFEIKLNNKTKYIEVKSTTSYKLTSFYISRNEFEFYKEYQKDYALYFVSNIQLNDEANLYSPNLIIVDGPKIEIDLYKSGFDLNENKILITPNSFLADW
ncbi:MAG: DUF3883 domain-containing protein [Metamycoplasmataceae bacterium]